MERLLFITIHYLHKIRLSITALSSRAHISNMLVSIFIGYHLFWQTEESNSSEVEFSLRSGQFRFFGGNGK